MPAQSYCMTRLSLELQNPSMPPRLTKNSHNSPDGMLFVENFIKYAQKLACEVSALLVGPKSPPVSSRHKNDAQQIRGISRPAQKPPNGKRTKITATKYVKQSRERYLHQRGHIKS